MTRIHDHMLVPRVFPVCQGKSVDVFTSQPQLGFPPYLLSFLVSCRFTWVCATDGIATAASNSAVVVVVPISSETRTACSAIAANSVILTCAQIVWPIFGMLVHRTLFGVYLSHGVCSSRLDKFLSWFFLGLCVCSSQRCFCIGCRARGGDAFVFCVPGVPGLIVGHVGAPQVHRSVGQSRCRRAPPRDWLPTAVGVCIG
jgi:hypothetical protein